MEEEIIRHQRNELLQKQVQQYEIKQKKLVGMVAGGAADSALTKEFDNFYGIFIQAFKSLESQLL